jgi:glycosyltransferase involved in cell wall biosynthesis
LSQDIDLEVVISDNCSSDATAALGRQLAAADPRVRYSRTETSLSPFQNFRRALEMARGDYFMWLGDDDWIDAGYLRAAHAALATGTGRIGVVGACRYYEGDALKGFGIATQCPADTGSQRVVDYFEQVVDNAIFYGLFPRAALLTTRLPVCYGGDWLFVGSLAFRGRLVTLDQPYLNRSALGDSADLAQLAASYGSTGFRARQKWFCLAMDAFRYLMWGDEALRAAGIRQRLSLARQVYDTICRRHNTSLSLAIRGELKLRSRLRGLLPR